MEAMLAVDEGRKGGQEKGVKLMDASHTIQSAVDVPMKCSVESTAPFSVSISPTSASVEMDRWLLVWMSDQGMD